MLRDEFVNNYWSQYLLLEKEFLNTLQFVTLDEDNGKAFSQVYLKLILELGSEIDVVFKQYCKLVDENFNGESIGKYRDLIKSKKSDFIKQEVSVQIIDRKISPWQDWNNPKLEAPYWWTIYNKIKHNRTDIRIINGMKQKNYKFANQENTLSALAGLYQILIYIYYDLAISENERILTPLPGSRIFRLAGGIWDSVSFWRDSAFYIDEQGNLFLETSNLCY